MGCTSSSDKDVDRDDTQLCLYKKKQLIQNGFDCLKDGKTDNVCPPEIQFVERNPQAELPHQGPHAYLGFWGKFRRTSDYQAWYQSENWKTHKADFKPGDVLISTRSKLGFHYFHWGLIVECEDRNNKILTHRKEESASKNRTDTQESTKSNIPPTN
jgi:hypothetical protein